MFSRLVLLACLVAGTVAGSVKCLNGGKPRIDGTEWRSCDCGPDYTGRFCGIPSRNFASHTVTKTNFETFTYVDIRNSNLTEEPAYSSHFYTVYQEFQSDDGSPIELLVEHLDPVYEVWCASGMDEALAGTVKLNGKGYGCSDLYHKVHRSNEGKFVLEVFLINGSDRYNMTVMAKKPLSDPYNKCKNGGSNLSLSSTTDQSTDNVPCTCPPDFTGSLCETPIDIFEVIKVDSPVQKVVHSHVPLCHEPSSEQAK
ncbi:hypothetical protein QR680_012031 [Steinernema hermaphroditum]|uniref:EGF-like domain-containing protein n=1 Tax=Steinernema hermaphroditum TaxID=289476 RepID=A0AA39LZT8_9BILA|nr:hypothetical protein QR680_012031 [Steinernema hermaphroditum]